jgi:hypothetical protein
LFDFAAVCTAMTSLPRAEGAAILIKTTGVDLAESLKNIKEAKHGTR